MELGRVRINMVQRLLRACRPCGARHVEKKSTSKGDVS